MTRRRKLKAPPASLAVREAQARRITAERKRAERQTDVDDIDEKMRRLRRERAEHAAAADRADDRRRLEHRQFIRHHGDDIARHRQSLVADALLGVSDDSAADIEPMSPLTRGA